MAINVTLLRFVIPVVSMSHAFFALVDMKDGTDAYSLLLTSHAITCGISSVGYIFYAKKQVCDTFIWYKNRRVAKNKIMIEADTTAAAADGKDAMCRDNTPFLSYQTGEGEGKRRLGTSMQLKEDIYAVLFCSLVKLEYREMISMEDGAGSSAPKVAPRKNNHIGILGTGALSHNSHSIFKHVPE